MAELRCGYGKDLDHYKNKTIDNNNLDIEVRLENGDTIEINTRFNSRNTRGGYAIRFKKKNKDKITLKDIDY